MSAGPLRLFVAPGSCSGKALVLGGEDAARAYQRGAREGDTIVVLDNSGWEISAVLDGATAEASHGRVIHRRLAAERRTKVSVYQGLLHGADFRRLLTRATELGVVSFAPVITDGSIVPSGGLGGFDADEGLWRASVREAAEASGRGRCPTIRGPMLFDHALDQATRGGTVLLVDPSGDPLSEALAGRPFAIEAFFSSPGGFTADERARARARGHAIVASPRASSDPIAPGLAVIETIYTLLDVEADADAQD
jgi:RsmE family RNA methyltransferase